MRHDLSKEWKMKDGTWIAIKSMQTSHIINTLNMLSKRGYIGVSSYNKTRNFYLTCSEPSGEMAQDCFYAELNYVLEEQHKRVHPSIDYLNKELEARGA